MLRKIDIVHKFQYKLYYVEIVKRMLWSEIELQLLYLCVWVFNTLNILLLINKKTFFFTKIFWKFVVLLTS